MAARILSQSGRVEWRDRATDAGGILHLVAEIAGELMRKASASPAEIRIVGIAWPGPGDYSLGQVQATFVPGFERKQDLFGCLNSACKTAFGGKWNPDCWRCHLDAAARALGELSAQGGAWNKGDLCSGTLLNVATGVAGAFVQGGNLVGCVDKLGETYGQWGRFLLWNTVSRTWSCRPTLDGSLPKLDSKVEVRLTEICGGPALARRFVHEWTTQSPQPADRDLVRMVEELSKRTTRDVKAERLLLMKITESAAEGNPTTQRFIQEAGQAIGSAMKCLWDSLGTPLFSSSVVLTGGNR